MSRETISGLSIYGLLALFIPTCIGCWSLQSGISHILYPGAGERTGSHATSAGDLAPRVDAAVHQLLSVAQANEVSQVQGQQMPARVNVCFVGIENRSSEELGNFTEQLAENIGKLINEHDLFQSINRHYVDATLRLTRLNPTDLSEPDNLGIYASAMEQNGQPFQYLLYAELTLGTTPGDKNKQIDYLLSLSLVEAATGQKVKATARVQRDAHHQALERISANDPDAAKKIGTK